MPIRDQIKSLYDRAVSWTRHVPPPPDIRDATRVPEGADTDAADLASRILGDRTRRQDGTANLAMLIAHQEQFASKWGAGLNVYWSRFDEALRENWTNALAMRRSSFVEELMSARKLPVSAMDWHVECDDRKDPDQKRAVERITKAIDAFPNFCSFRYYLGEDKWQGKYGSQIQWAKIRVDGDDFISVVGHQPVDGDSIVYGYDNTPGILVRSGWVPARKDDHVYLFQPKSEWVKATDRARALFLYDQFWRDHFVISHFNPRSADYLYEGDKAAAIFGLGYRGMLYWDFQLREELRSWLIDALQRVGVNGMMYGFFESGNRAMMNEVILSLKMIHRDNVAAFPYTKGQVPNKIEHIDPSAVGYDVLAHWIDALEQTMRRCVLGQSLSSMVGATGMGSEVARLHEQTIQHVIKSDCSAQQELITRDIIGPMIRFNQWTYRGKILKGTLPFNVRFVYNFDKADMTERAQVINTAFQMGVPLSIEQIHQDLGLSPPKSPEDTLKNPGDPSQQQGPGQPGQDPEQEPEQPEVADMAAGAAHRGIQPGMNKRLHIERGPDGKLVIRKASLNGIAR